MARAQRAPPAELQPPHRACRSCLLALGVPVMAPPCAGQLSSARCVRALACRPCSTPSRSPRRPSRPFPCVPAASLVLSSPPPPPPSPPPAGDMACELLGPSWVAELRRRDLSGTARKPAGLRPAAAPPAVAAGSACRAGACPAGSAELSCGPHGCAFKPLRPPNERKLFWAPVFEARLSLHPPSPS